MAFLADRDGELDLFAGLLATGDFNNLTETWRALTIPWVSCAGPASSGDSARVWFGIAPRQKLEMPWSGGSSRPSSQMAITHPAWSSDGRLVYFNNLRATFCGLADGAGQKCRGLEIEWPGRQAPSEANHNHNMVWSPDNKWLYLVHGTVRDWNRPDRRDGHLGISPSGASPERLTYLNSAVSFLAMLDQDTLVFVAPGQNGFGSWLWSLDVGSTPDVRAWWGARAEYYPSGFLPAPSNTRRSPRAATGSGGGHAGQPDSQPLQRADSRRPQRRQRPTSCRSWFKPNGHWRRATRGVPRRRCCFSCRRAARATGCGGSIRRQSRLPRARKGT